VQRPKIGLGCRNPTTCHNSLACCTKADKNRKSCRRMIRLMRYTEDWLIGCAPLWDCFVHRHMLRQRRRGLLFLSLNNRFSVLIGWMFCWLFNGSATHITTLAIAWTMFTNWQLVRTRYTALLRKLIITVIIIIIIIIIIIMRIRILRTMFVVLSSWQSYWKSFTRKVKVNVNVDLYSALSWTHL